MVHRAQWFGKGGGQGLHGRSVKVKTVFKEWRTLFSNLEKAHKKVYYYYYYYYYYCYFSGPRGLVISIRANFSHILGLVKINKLFKTSFFFHFKLTVHQRRERPTETERRRGKKIKEIMTRENSNTIVSHHTRDRENINITTSHKLQSEQLQHITQVTNRENSNIITSHKLQTDRTVTPSHHTSYKQREQ